MPAFWAALLVSVLTAIMTWLVDRRQKD